jgi:cyclopropane fatty-acyl-phospholipid synthase-like methyltransferase
MVIAVIGSGYGRELAIFGPKVTRAYGIDVSELVHAEMAGYLKAKKVANVVPVLAEGWAEALPAGLDLVYSVATFQHLTRDLVRDYLWGTARKLGQPDGRAILQFAENERGTEDAEDKAYEPNVKWTAEEIALAMADAGLELVEIKTMTGIHRNGREWKWHWTLSRSVIAEEE